MKLCCISSMGYNKLWASASVPAGCCHEAEQEAIQHTLLHVVQGCFHPSKPVLIILQQAEEHTIFSFKPRPLHMVGWKKLHPFQGLYFRFTASFKLGRCIETVQSSWVSNSTITGQKTNLVLITCSLTREVEALRTKPKQPMTQQDKHLPPAQCPRASLP